MSLLGRLFGGWVNYNDTRLTMDSNQVAIEKIAKALFSSKYQKPAYVIVIAQNDLNNQFSKDDS